jgi:hypothetical protein
MGFKGQWMRKKWIPFTCQKQIGKETSVSAQNILVSDQKENCISLNPQKQLMSTQKIFL